MREMGRILGWQGVKLKRAGKNEAAITLWTNFYHAMTLATQGDSISIDYLVDHAIASIATAGSNYPNPKGKKLSEEQRIQGFIADANKYHRPDLAQQIEKDWKANHALFTKLRTDFKENNYFKSSLTLAETGVFFLQGTVWIILSIAGALLGWILLNAWCFQQRNKSTFAETLIDDWNQYKGIFACSGFPSFLLGMLFLAAIVSLINLLIPANINWGWGISHIFQMPGRDTFISGIIESLSYTTNLNSYPFYWRLLIFFTPLICGALFAFFYSRGEKRKSTLRQKVSENIYLALLFSAWGIIALTSEYHWLQIALAVICGIFLLASFLRMWRLTKGNHILTFSTFRFNLGGWICTGSILTLILLISQSVMNRKLQPWANNQIRGEMHLLHNVQDSAP